MIAAPTTLPGADVVAVGILGPSTEPRAALLDAIAAFGATAEVLTEATALEKAYAVSALVFDVGDAPEHLLPAAASLASHPRTCALPRIVIVGATVSAARLAPFGTAAIVPENAAGEELGRAISGALEQARGRDEALRAARAAADDVRMLEQMLAAVQREGVTLSHDARVLFGIILGFASNLRDGFAGPVTELQQRQLVNIVEASNDATALLDRHVAALRRLVPPSAEATPPASAPAPVRRHIDLGELVRGTVALFHGLAAAKRIRLAMGASVAARAWCDPMQVKQALVNLVSNALKFTPAEGSVTVAVRPDGASAREGAPERQSVEIVVSDTGPGIPEHERERVFERGVRLERDMAIPGTGVGLAIVRDIVTLHGGAVRVEETAGGGATIALVFPADLRARTEDPPHTNGTASSPRIRSTAIPPSSPRRAELRGEPE